MMNYILTCRNYTRKTRTEAHSWNLWIRFLILPDIILLATYIVLVVASYYLQYGKFWSPNVVKALTMFSTTLNTISWAGIDDALRLMEPFRQFATNQPSITRVDATNADYEGLNPISRIFCGSLIVAGVSIDGVLFRTFTVIDPALLESVWKTAYLEEASAPVPKTLQTSTQVLKWTNVPVGLFTLFIFVSLFSRSSSIVPRKPSTLSSKVLYLCRSSKLLGDVHVALIADGKLAEKLRKQRKAYRLGWFQFDEARIEFQQGVEREPILQPYSYTGSKRFDVEMIAQM